MSVLRLVCSAVALGTLLVPSSRLGAEETLVEAAARERARRSAQPAKEVPTYGQDDLEKLRKTRPKGGQYGSGDAVAPSADTGVDTADPTDPGVIASWQGRVQAARSAVTAIEARIAASEQKIRALRAGGGLGGVTDPNRERANRDDVAAALEDIEASKAELEEARQRLEQTLEDARRAGIAAHLLETPPPSDTPPRDESSGAAGPPPES